MGWRSSLLETVVKKSRERLSREWSMTGASRSPAAHARVLRRVRSAGVKPGMEGKTYRVAKPSPSKESSKPLIAKNFKPATPQKK